MYIYIYVIRSNLPLLVHKIYQSNSLYSNLTENYGYYCQIDNFLFWWKQVIEDRIVGDLQNEPQPFFLHMNMIVMNHD